MRLSLIFRSVLAAAVVVLATVSATTGTAETRISAHIKNTSHTYDLAYYRHDTESVIDPNPDPNPSSPTRTPTVCMRRVVALDAGTYSYGTHYAYDGTSYDREGVFFLAGFYSWSDCLFPVSDGYLQTSRVYPTWIEDDGTGDAAEIAHPRGIPSALDRDDAGRVGWGSFLERVA